MLVWCYVLYVLRIYPNLTKYIASTNSNGCFLVHSLQHKLFFECQHPLDTLIWTYSSSVHGCSLCACFKSQEENVVFFLFFFLSFAYFAGILELSNSGQIIKKNKSAPYHYSLLRWNKSIWKTNTFSCCYRHTNTGSDVTNSRWLSAGDYWSHKKGQHALYLHVSKLIIHSLSYYALDESRT